MIRSKDALLAAGSGVPVRGGTSEQSQEFDTVAVSRRRDPDASKLPVRVRYGSTGTSRHGCRLPSRCRPKPRVLALSLLCLLIMASGIWAAAAGAVGQVAHLDTAANNLANIETPGYRVDRMVFRRALEGSLKGHRPHQTMEASVVRSVSHDMRAGRIVPTGRDLDVALSDDNAFFAVQTPHGTRYTRAGNLSIMPDGTLTGPTGTPYLGVNQQPVVVSPVATSVEISTTGELKVDGETDGQRLMVVQFPDFEQLQKEGDVLMFAPMEAGPPSLMQDPFMQTGALEKTTDTVFEYMSEVTTASRNFDILTQVIQAFRDVETKAARDIHGK